MYMFQRNDSVFKGEREPEDVLCSFDQNLSTSTWYYMEDSLIMKISQVILRGTVTSQYEVYGKMCIFLRYF